MPRIELDEPVSIPIVKLKRHQIRSFHNAQGVSLQSIAKMDHAKKIHWGYGHKNICLPVTTGNTIISKEEDNEQKKELINSLYKKESCHFKCHNPKCNKLETKSETYLQCSRCEYARYVLYRCTVLQFIIIILIF